jgi:hypothetical protein
MCSYRKRGDKIYHVIKILYLENGSNKLLKIFEMYIKAYMTSQLEVYSNELK